MRRVPERSEREREQHFTYCHIQYSKKSTLPFTKSSVGCTQQHRDACLTNIRSLRRPTWCFDLHPFPRCRSFCCCLCSISLRCRLHFGSSLMTAENIDFTVSYVNTVIIFWCLNMKLMGKSSQSYEFKYCQWFDFWIGGKLYFTGETQVNSTLTSLPQKVLNPSMIGL